LITYLINIGYFILYHVEDILERNKRSLVGTNLMIIDFKLF